ncbi:MAG: hypothetical protein FWD01_05105 [Defluviitaleaceae bacterium]|nr:hypothetical protein [Defluviitaleaceae bacterium]
MIKFKKLLFVAALAIFALSACNGSAEETESTTVETVGTAVGTQNATENVAVPAWFSLPVNGFVIELNQDIQIVLNNLGEPLGMFEAPSCAFDGIDRIFSFPGLQIHTYPVGDNDFVHTISIRDDSISTTNGIYLGSGFADMLEAYGTDYIEEFGMYTFTNGRYTLEFFVENDIIMGITYGFIIE